MELFTDCSGLTVNVNSIIFSKSNFFYSEKAEKEGRSKKKNESVLNCERRHVSSFSLFFFCNYLCTLLFSPTLTIFMGMKWKYLARILGINVKKCICACAAAGTPFKVVSACAWKIYVNVSVSVSATAIALFFHSRHFLIIEKQSVATAANWIIISIMNRWKRKKSEQQKRLLSGAECAVNCKWGCWGHRLLDARYRYR